MPRSRGRDRCRSPRRSTTSWSSPRCTTTSATSGTSGSSTSPGAGTGAASSCASTPPPTARWCGSATSEVGEHEGGYTPFEADLTAVAVAGEAAAGHGRGQQRADLDLDPAGRHRRPRRGEAPAVLLPRLLQLRRPASAASGCARTAPTAPGRRHGRHGPRRRHGRSWPGRRPSRATAAVRVVLRDADGTTVADGEGRDGRAAGPRRPPLGARATATSTTSRSSSSTADALVDSYHQTVGVRTVRGATAPGS